jgi:hypothetical protein
MLSGTVTSSGLFSAPTHSTENANNTGICFFLKHCWVAAWMERQNMPSTDTVFVFDSDVVPYRVHEPALDHWTDLFEEDVVLYTKRRVEQRNRCW